MNSLSLPARRRENYSLYVYTDKAAEHRWAMDDRRNGLRISAAAEGYKNLGDCIINCWTTTGWLPDGFETAADWDDDARGIKLRTEGG